MLGPIGSLRPFYSVIDVDSTENVRLFRLDSFINIRYPLMNFDLLFLLVNLVRTLISKNLNFL